jgi:type VI secretion system protein ImpL
VNFLGLRIWEWAIVAVGSGFALLGAYLLARWSWKWFVALLIAIAAVVFLVVLPRYVPSHSFLNPDTPGIFLDFFWGWMLALLLGVAFSVVFVARLVRSARPAREELVSDDSTRFPDIDAAWKEILVRLGQAGIDPGRQNAYLVLAPHEDWAASLVRSAGLQVFAQGPDSASPIHAYATSEGVLLSASGASGFGTHEPEGPARLEYLGRLLRAQNPECPPLRGVAVVFPIRWAGQPDSVAWAAAIREDLQAVRRSLKMRCPVFALFTEMETVPGFAEFFDRMPAALRMSRCGFAVPSTHPFSGDLVQDGLVWMSGWVHGWVLNLMAEDVLNHPGNRRLFQLDHEFRRYRRRLRTVAESAFSTHREAEPVMFRGCYFAATGTGTDEQAFSAGLLRGPRGRIFAEHAATRWTAQAEEDDRYYRRLALAVGLVGGALASLAWAYILTVAPRPLAWIGLGLVVVTWGVTLFRLPR